MIIQATSGGERILPEPAERELAFLQTLRPGQIVTGTMIEIAGFAVTFVDIGGFTAMIDIPQLSGRPIKRPSDVVAVGQEISARVLDVDTRRGRVPLSLKALQVEPLADYSAGAARPSPAPSPRSLPSVLSSASKRHPTAS
ncbi:S1 RNA-binding domain-containing protein [Actinomadura oligospora]|uniref:S1 RNA-binding domain-containing protein n=1 Tax=Actinomadura oligospora TaxID=111804 RepID=UPI00047D03F4|nr:S1 RNA-binding domain-containing protein [Actinomadura oligospora]